MSAPAQLRQPTQPHPSRAVGPPTHPPTRKVLPPLYEPLLGRRKGVQLQRRGAGGVPACVALHCRVTASRRQHPAAGAGAGGSEAACAAQPACGGAPGQASGAAWPARGCPPQEQLAAGLQGDGRGVAALQRGRRVLQLPFQPHHRLCRAVLDYCGEGLRGRARNGAGASFSNPKSLGRHAHGGMPRAHRSRPALPPAVPV